MTAYVVERPVKNDVQAPRWLGYASGKTHAFLVPAGPLESVSGDGKIKSVCGKSLDVTRLVGDGQRCKPCATAMADDTRKRGSGLSEAQVDNVDTGAQDGDPRDAEKRRTAELAPLSGDAAEQNANIAEALREGDREGAVESARALDAQGLSAAVPEAGRAPVGSRDHGMLDGVAMVQGRNMDPVQGTWYNPRTKEREPAAAYLGGSLTSRPDREASTVPMHGGAYGYLTLEQYEALSRSQRRKYWSKVKRMADFAKAKRVASRARGVKPAAPTGTGGVGGKSFTEGGSRETERLMQQPRS